MQKAIIKHKYFKTRLFSWLVLGEPSAGDVGAGCVHWRARLLGDPAGHAELHRVAALQAGAHDRQRRVEHPHRGHRLLRGQAVLGRQVRPAGHGVHEEFRVPGKHSGRSRGEMFFFVLFSFFQFEIVSMRSEKHVIAPYPASQAVPNLCL